MTPKGTRNNTRIVLKKTNLLGPFEFDFGIRDIDGHSSKDNSGFMSEFFERTV